MFPQLWRCAAFWPFVVNGCCGVLLVAHVPKRTPCACSLPWYLLPAVVLGQAGKPCCRALPIPQVWTKIALDPQLPAQERSAVPFVLLLQVRQRGREPPGWRGGHVGSWCSGAGSGCGCGSSRSMCSWDTLQQGRCKRQQRQVQQRNAAHALHILSVAPLAHSA